MPLIHCSSLQQVAWTEPFRDLESNSAHIYRLQLSSNACQVDKAKTILSNDEISRASRYFQPKDVQRFILSRAALRLIMSRYIGIPPRNLVFTIGANKKPFLPRAGKVQYNVSHAGDWAVIAISDHPVGVDVEYLDPSYDYRAVLDMCFSPEESVTIESAPDSISTFYSLWTRKEALVKATAKGMDDTFKFVPAMDGVHTASAETIGSQAEWHVTSFPLADQHISSLAHNPAINSLSFFNAAGILAPL